MREGVTIRAQRIELKVCKLVTIKKDVGKSCLWSCKAFRSPTMISFYLLSSFVVQFIQIFRRLLVHLQQNRILSLNDWSFNDFFFSDSKLNQAHPTWNPSRWRSVRQTYVKVEKEKWTKLCWTCFWTLAHRSDACVKASITQHKKKWVCQMANKL